jgi:hypothetical protein
MCDKKTSSIVHAQQAPMAREPAGALFGDEYPGRRMKDSDTTLTDPTLFSRTVFQI